MLNRHRWVIDPQGRYMSWWDPITSAALLFVAIVTPAEIAFTTNKPINPVAGLFWINRVVDLVFIKDMMMQ